jgi:uncharacterized protein YhaN
MYIECPICGEENRKEEFSCKRCGWPIGWLRVPVLTKPSPDWVKGFEEVLSFSRKTYSELQKIRRELIETKKKVADMSREISAKDEMLKRLREEQQKLQKELETLNRELTLEKKLRKEKEIELSQKEKKLEELRKKNKELEKMIEEFKEIQEKKKTCHSVVVYYSINRLSSGNLGVEIRSKGSSMPRTVLVFNPKTWPLTPKDGKPVEEFAASHTNSVVKRIVNFREEGYFRLFSPDENVICIGNGGGKL